MTTMDVIRTGYNRIYRNVEIIDITTTNTGDNCNDLTLETKRHKAIVDGLNARAKSSYNLNSLSSSNSMITPMKSSSLTSENTIALSSSCYTLETKAIFKCMVCAIDKKQTFDKSPLTG